MEEIWKPVHLELYKELYMVSNLGRVKSLKRYKTKPTHIKILSKNKNGYMVTQLKSKNHCQRVKVHRLVAVAFLTNPLGYPLVHHRDGDKCNNIYTNLEWVNHSMNMRYKTKTLDIHWNSQPILIYDSNSDFLFKADNCKEAAYYMGVSKRSVKRYLNKSSKWGYGVKFILKKA